MKRGGWWARLVVLMLVVTPAVGQSIGQGLDDLTRIEALAAADSAAALDEIDRLLSVLAVSGEATPSVVHDLTRLATDVLATSGRHAEAAVQLERLGTFVTRNRRLDLSPIPLWDAAIAEYRLSGDLRGAQRSAEAVLDEERDSGLSGAVLAQTMTQLSDLAQESGDAAAATGWRDAAAAALAAPAPPARGAGEGFRRIAVYYATDRARSGDPAPEAFYGAGRGTLELGVTEVTVPDTHEPGAIETRSIWRLEFGPSATRHVMLRAVTPLESDAFFARMQGDLGTLPRKEIVVFVHGFNVTFASAAKRAAQLANDMHYRGVPVLYSWPSRGTTMGYVPDTAVVQLSGRRLSRFLDDLVDRSGATTIHIVAHSMGNRALADALELMALRRQQVAGMPPLFDQVVFAAPDVDAGLFTEVMPTIALLARRLTLYGSENDWALGASRKLHGDAARAGQGGADMLASDWVDSVDVSALGEDMLAHGYFADDRSALVDLATLFWRNLAPGRRCGMGPAGPDAGPLTWQYLPKTCPDAALLAVLGNLQDQDVETPGAASRAVNLLVQDPTLLGEIEPVVERMMTN